MESFYFSEDVGNVFATVYWAANLSDNISYLYQAIYKTVTEVLQHMASWDMVL